MGLGLVTALRFTRALSNGSDIQNEKWLRTDYSRLDIKHLLRWDLSPLPVHGVDSRCWRQFRDACMLPGHVSKGPFQSYGVRRHLVNRARNDVLHKNKERLFSIFPAPYPRNSPTGPLQKYSPPPGPNDWTCSCGWAGDSNRSNWLHRASMTV